MIWVTAQTVSHDRQWFGWGELCRDTRNCIVTEGLIDLGECHDTISVS